ncbi:MAG TPA: hypothetical protein VNT58_07190 [Gaiellaceae bacterium]|nr:hypothetical protein [Gaiellaceae bacterium]
MNAAARPKTPHMRYLICLVAGHVAGGPASHGERDASHCRRCGRPLASAQTPRDDDRARDSRRRNRRVL